MHDLNLPFCRQASLKFNLLAFGNFGSDQRIDVIAVDLVGGLGKHFNHWSVPSIFEDMRMVRSRQTVFGFRGLTTFSSQNVAGCLDVGFGAA